MGSSGVGGCTVCWPLTMAAAQKSVRAASATFIVMFGRQIRVATRWFAQLAAYAARIAISASAGDVKFELQEGMPKPHVFTLHCTVSPNLLGLGRT